MKNIPEYYPIYDTVYGTEIPTEQYYVIKFDTLPSKYVNVIFYDISVIDFFKEMGFVEVVNIFSSNRRLDLSAQSLYENIDKKI